MNDYESASFFERLKKGMEESIAHSRGEISLKTTTLPAPPPQANRAKVIALRKKLKMSQSVFAAALNVSTKLVQSWEQGLRKPDRGELRLIEMLGRQPDLIRLILTNNPIESPQKVAAPTKRGSRKRTASAA
jgi:putative transcriptional regulator